MKRGLFLILVCLFLSGCSSSSKHTVEESNLIDITGLQINNGTILSFENVIQDTYTTLPEYNETNTTYTSLSTLGNIKTIELNLQDIGINSDSEFTVKFSN